MAILPLLDLLLQTFGIQFNATALGKQWRYEAYTKFDRFLDGEFHFFATGHYLTQMDMQRRFAVIYFAALHFNQNIFLTGFDNYRFEDLIATVKSSIA